MMWDFMEKDQVTPDERQHQEHSNGSEATLADTW